MIASAAKALCHERVIKFEECRREKRRVGAHQRIELSLPRDDIGGAELLLAADIEVIAEDIVQQWRHFPMDGKPYVPELLPLPGVSFSDLPLFGLPVFPMLNGVTLAAPDNSSEYYDGHRCQG